MLVSQSCAVANSNNFWQATRQSNLADTCRMEDCSTGQSAVVHCVSTTTTTTKLWKFLLQPVICMPSLIIQWPTRFFLRLGKTVYDCETWLIPGRKNWNYSTRIVISLSTVLVLRSKRYLCSCEVT